MTQAHVSLLRVYVEHKCSTLQVFQAQKYIFETSVVTTTRPEVKYKSLAAAKPTGMDGRWGQAGGTKSALARTCFEFKMCASCGMRMCHELPCLEIICRKTTCTMLITAFLVTVCRCAVKQTQSTQASVWTRTHTPNNRSTSNKPPLTGFFFTTGPICCIFLLQEQDFHALRRSFHTPPCG